MARIRTIKPDALQHRKVGRLSDRAFRVWVGLLTQADDEGRLPCDPDQVKAWCFAYHGKVTTKQVEEAIQEIKSLGLLSLYGINGTRYAYFPSWKDHQKINHPSPALYPGPPIDIPVELPEESCNATGTLPGEGKEGKEGRGEEGKGREGSVRETKGVPFQEILDDLNEKIRTKYTPTDKHKELISARWKEGHILDDFRRVHSNMIEAWFNDPKMREYLRPVTLYSNKFQSYLNRIPKQPLDSLSEAGRATYLAGQEWLRKEEEKDAKAGQGKIPEDN